MHIREGDVVLDPMCGAGTLLIEAYMTQPYAIYLGGDHDSGQITKSVSNTQHLNRNGENCATISIIKASAYGELKFQRYFNEHLVVG